MKSYQKIAVLSLTLFILCFGSFFVFASPADGNGETRGSEQSNFWSSQFTQKDGAYYQIQFRFIPPTDEVNWLGKLKITLLDSDGKELQIFDSSGVDRLRAESYYITDVNFDGYRDIFILDRIGGVRANHYYSLWIWNSKDKSFEKQDLLPPNLAIDRKNKQLLSIETYTASEKGYKIFEFKEGKFRLTHRLDWRAEGENGSEEMSYFFKETEFPNGKAVVVKEIAVHSKTDPSYGEAYQRYYHPESFWCLGNRRWYQSDYGDNLGIIRNGKEIRTKMDVE